ncbi:MAG: DUF1211 domain-containing protein [bacterium]|nr:DUF1211 domain-containing protein [bacterium]
MVKKKEEEKPQVKPSQSTSMKFLSTGRLAALVDGTFAIAMTLLILEIQVPTIIASATSEAVESSLLDMWPTFFDYGLSFLILGFFWLSHNKQYKHLGRTDDRYIWLTLLGLMFVVLIPFSTELIGSYNDTTASEIFFHMNMLAILGFSYLQGKYVDKHRGLVDADRFVHESFKQGMDTTRLFIFVTFIGIGLSFVIPDWSNGVYLIVPAWFMIKKRMGKQ